MRPNIHLINLIKNSAINISRQKTKHTKPFVSSLRFFRNVFPEIQAAVKEKAKMLSVIVPFHRNIIKTESRVIGLFILMRENNFNSLFGNIWIELHLPLIGPFLNCLKVPD